MKTKTSWFQRAFASEPLNEARRRHRKRTKKDNVAPPRLARIGMILAAALLAAFTAASVYLIVQNPKSIGAYSVAWIFGWPAVMLIGMLTGAFPLTSKPVAISAVTLVLGAMAIPFLGALLTDFNFLTLIVAAFFAVPFAVIATHWGRLAKLHGEGYHV